MSTTPISGRVTADDQASLVSRLKSDDESVLEDVLRTIGPRVDGLLKMRHPFLRPEDREEFLIEALFRVWQARAQFDPAKGSLQAWYFSIAENLLKDRLKRKRCQEHVCDPADLVENHSLKHRSGRWDDTPDSVSPSPEARILGTILEQLTDVERRIVLAYAHTGGQGQWAVDLAEELATDLGVAIRPGTIRVKRIRIYDKIRRRMQHPE